MELIGLQYMIIVHLNRLGSSGILCTCTYVISEYRILNELASVGLEREAEDFMCETVEVIKIETIPSNDAYVSTRTQTRERHSIASTSVCSFPVACTDTI
jgi:hypothetical protein